MKNRLRQTLLLPDIQLSQFADMTLVATAIQKAGNRALRQRWCRQIADVFQVGDLLLVAAWHDPADPTTGRQGF